MVQSFIDKVGPYAVEHGTKGGILPALIIAQGILESTAGRSELAIEANNLFGIKKGVGWSGPVYAKSSKEWSESIGWYEAVSEFRKYDSFEGSVIDLVEFYQRDRYSEVRGQTDFLEAATAAWRAGYATDPNYPQKLLYVYTQNNLEGFTMSDKILVIEAGHGWYNTTPGKRGPDGRQEWSWNNPVVLAAIAHITTAYNGVRVVRVDDPTGRTDVPLATRVNRANAAKADLYISVHHNAMSHSWTNAALGVETYVMTPASANPGSVRAANEIHPRIVAAMGLRDRGVKAANFQVLRTTNMPAVLTEGGFMDSRVDRAAMDQPSRLQAQGRAIADGAAAYLKLSRRQPAQVPASGSPAWFRVRLSWADAESQKGAFLNASEARALADVLKDEGYKVFDSTGKVVYDPKPPVVVPVSAQRWLRVRKTWDDAEGQRSAHLSLEAAIASADAAKEFGFVVFDDTGRAVHIPDQGYKIGAEDRLGEAELNADTPYYILPDSTSYQRSQLKKGRGSDGRMHYFEIRNGWVRLGVGWVPQPLVIIRNNYKEDAARKSLIDEAIKMGIVNRADLQKTEMVENTIVNVMKALKK